MATDISHTPPDLGNGEKSPETTYEKAGVKTAHNLHAGQDVELENGHLAELEVDMSRVLSKAEEEGDYEADTSPFPQVSIFFHSWHIFRAVT